MFQHPDVGMLQGAYVSKAYREIFGVHHIKAAVFDNHVVLTGANLNQTYFTNRTDRFWVIKNCEPLADYIADLLAMSKLLCH